MIKKIKLINDAVNKFLDFPSTFKDTKLKKVFFLRNEQVETLCEKINNYSYLSKLNFKFFFSGYDNNLPLTNKKFDKVVNKMEQQLSHNEKTVFSLLENSVKPLKAYSILFEIQKKGIKSPWKPRN